MRQLRSLEIAAELDFIADELHIVRQRFDPAPGLRSGVVTAVLLSEQFPTRVRYTASAFTYNLAYTIFGGTAPLIATWLIEQTGDRMSPAYYLIVIALLALVGGLALPESSKRPLNYRAD